LKVCCIRERLRARDKQAVFESPSLRHQVEFQDPLRFGQREAPPSSPKNKSSIDQGGEQYRRPTASQPVSEFKALRSAITAH
jgi:hypothetical protein